MERKCCICGTEITACFGYVVARDFVKYIEGKQNYVREICGKDVLRLDLEAETNHKSLGKVLESYL
jgi:hypothetical protein